MFELAILSPHRDDAAFSLLLALSRWSGLSVQLTVVTFFTKSDYAPHALSTRVSPISALRKREDSFVLRSIDRRIRLESLDLLDAPLRFGIRANATSRPETAALLDPEEIDAIARRVHKYFARGLVLAPLGLGDHVDHLAVNRAACANSVDHKLGFYEDLPYATWSSKLALRLRLCEIEDRTRVRLRPTIIRSPVLTLADKRRLIARYQSQITPQDATGIAKYASNYRGCERVWIPRYGRFWKAFIKSDAEK